MVCRVSRFRVQGWGFRLRIYCLVQQEDYGSLMEIYGDTEGAMAVPAHDSPLARFYGFTGISFQGTYSTNCCGGFRRRHVSTGFF